MSVITADRLRKFNDARGTVAGTVTEELAAATKAAEADVAELENNQAGEVGDNGEGAADVDREEEMDEVASQLM